MQQEQETKISRATLLRGSGALLAALCAPRFCRPQHDVTTPPGPEPTYLTQGMAGFERRRKGFNKRFNPVPRRIALCLNENEVAHAVLKAREQDLKVAVKSGGHSFEGFSLSDGGMLIDLAALKKQSYSPQSRIYRAGPGVKLRGAYDFLLPRKRIVSMGSCGGVGLGGLTLGGGYGLFAREQGLTCDQLVAVDMVDGLGRVHKDLRDPQLLRAIRGGGNGNFGIITDMQFRTRAMPEKFVRYLYKEKDLKAERAALLMERWFEIAAGLPRSAFSAFVLKGDSLTVLVTDAAQTPSAAIKKSNDALGALLQKTFPVSTLPTPRALRRFYGVETPIFFKNASAGYYKSFADLKAVAGQLTEMVAASPGTIFQVNTLGGEIANPEYKPTSVYPHRDFPFLGELQNYWKLPEEEPERLVAFRKIQDLLKSAGIDRHYRNYPDADFEDWEDAYYGENYADLQAIKETYDPENRIAHAQSVRA